MEASNRKKLNKAKGILLGVLLVLLLSIPILNAAAKYIQEESHDALVQARLFYFTSDLLAEDGAEYELNPGTDSVTFVLRNHEDKYRRSEDAIEYHIFVNGEEDMSKSGTMTADANQDVPITIDGLENGKTYVIEARGIAGYEKILSATFTVKSADQAVYKHLDTSNNAYVLLTVWAQNVSGQLQVTIPAGLIPDDTDPVLDAQVSNYAGGSYGVATITETINTTYSSRTYRFFKADSTAKFDVSQFAVSLNDITAEQGTP